MFRALVRPGSLSVLFGAGCATEPPHPPQHRDGTLFEKTIPPYFNVDTEPPRYAPPARGHRRPSQDFVHGFGADWIVVVATPIPPTPGASDVYRTRASRSTAQLIIVRLWPKATASRTTARATTRTPTATTSSSATTATTPHGNKPTGCRHQIHDTGQRRPVVLGHVSSSWANVTYWEPGGRRGDVARALLHGRALQKADWLRAEQI